MLLLDNNTYHKLFVEIADKRVEKWILMKDPTYILSILTIYLFGIYYYLPNYMKERKAYDLKNIIQIYNVFQIIVCSCMVYGLAINGWLTGYTLGCEVVDYSDNPSAVAMVHLTFWNMIIKIIELVETCFFILRHKQNQVSKLHVFHHSSTLAINWVCCKYVAGGMGTMPMLINSIVHIIMYIYYFLATLGPKLQKRLAKFKPMITKMQLTQFLIVIIHALQALKADCNFPNVIVFLFCPYIIIIAAFFINFYVKSYKKKKLIKD